MTKDLVIIALGFWVAVLPFLGFPNSWDRILLVISGLSISALMFFLRRDFFAYVERLRRRKREQQTEVFVQSDIPAESEAPTPTPTPAPRRRRSRTKPAEELERSTYAQEDPEKRIQ